MDARFNLFIPLACPFCRAELLPTLDQVQHEESIRCSRCGTLIDLRTENAPLAETPTPHAAEFLAL